LDDLKTNKQKIRKQTNKKPQTSNGKYKRPVIPTLLKMLLMVAMTNTNENNNKKLHENRF
jgi:hypothetical protein